VSAEKAVAGYVDLLLHEWQMERQFPRIRRCVRKILNELSGESQLALWREPRLEVKVIPGERGSARDVWAYFPISPRRLIARGLNLRPDTRVLLLLTAPGWMRGPMADLEGNLRHHLGHTLLYLRNPRGRNECSDADREWRNSIGIDRRGRVQA